MKIIKMILLFRRNQFLTGKEIGRGHTSDTWSVFFFPLWNLNKWIGLGAAVIYIFDLPDIEVIFVFAIIFKIQLN